MRHIEYINPLDESVFPGITKYYNELLAWDWVYGKTPPFTITRNFKKLIKTVENIICFESKIEKGKIHNLQINTYNIAPVNPKVFTTLQLGLEGIRLDDQDVLKALSHVKMEWIQHRLYTTENHDLLDWLLLCVIETLGFYWHDSST